MLIKIISIGSPPSKEVENIILDYTKRLIPFSKVEWLNTTVKSKNKNIDVNKEIESKTILNSIKPGSYVIALDEDGESIKSRKLASLFEKIMLQTSEIIFVIGGADGLDQSVLEKSNYQLSLSSMTYPHQIVKIILIEQIYRAFSILNNQPYHRE